MRPDASQDPDAKRRRLFVQEQEQEHVHIAKPQRVRVQQQQQQRVEEIEIVELLRTPPGLVEPPVVSPRQSTPRTPVAQPQVFSYSPSIAVTANRDLLTETVSKAVKVVKRPMKIVIKRKALPLIPAYSITTHKSQGQTLRKIFVDLVMPPGPVEVASVYVPLSRVKRLDDLLIVRPFNFSSLQVKPTAAQMEELNRLNKITINTRKHFPTPT
ncbi:unnamed protein product [Rotaria magnacalcarata]|uniref:ATP-dependent DNA helicase n=1 Tax=Rotaria magnacalcarata TaxID=392030 RepID=A0A819S0M3_9BILA|nr:unnamed protein product [Rotaria magnacalcarata]